MDLEKIKSEIAKYLQELNQKIKIEKVFIYGSLATGNVKEHSDVDLLIISSDFSQLDEFERIRLLYTSFLGFPYNLHIYGITPEEYENASPLTILGSIKQQRKLAINL